MSKDYDSDDVIDLLLYNEHYMYIKHINNFFKTDQKHTKFLCRRCMSAFEQKVTLERHKEKCEVHDYCYVKMPTSYVAVLSSKTIILKTEFHL